MKVNQQLTCRGYASHYSFLHSSVQDFLCALWTAKQTITKQNEVVRAVLDYQPMSLVLPFVAGLTKFRNNVLLPELLAVTKHPLDAWSVIPPLVNDPKASSDPRRKLLALLHCIYESGMYEHFQKVKPPSAPANYHNEGGDIILSLHSYKLSCHDCTVLGTFLAVVCSKLCCSLDLVFSQVGDNELIHLLKPIMERKPAAAKKDIHQYRVGLVVKEKRLIGVKRTISLCLDSNIITHISVGEALKPVLSTLSVISVLGLEGNFHSSSTNTFKVMAHLIEGLHRNSSCRFLALANCNLDSSRHIYHWILLLTMQSILNGLGLSLTDLSEGFSLFCSALRCSNLVSIFMDYTGLDDTDILTLASAIKSHKFLLKISIKYNPFSPNSLRKFIQTLFDDTSETRLSMVCVEDDKIDQMCVGWELLPVIYFLSHMSLLEQPTEITAASTQHAISDMANLALLRAKTLLPKTLLTGEK